MDNQKKTKLIIFLCTEKLRIKINKRGTWVTLWHVVKLLLMPIPHSPFVLCVLPCDVANICRACGLAVLRNKTTQKTNKTNNMALCKTNGN